MADHYSTLWYIVFVDIGFVDISKLSNRKNQTITTRGKALATQNNSSVNLDVNGKMRETVKKKRE